MRRTNRLQTSISEVRAAQGKLVEGWKEESDVTFLFSRDKSDTSPTVSEATTARSIVKHFCVSVIAQQSC